MLIDSHAHLCNPAFGKDQEAMLERAQQVGIASIINITTNPEELAYGLKLSKRYPWIYNVGATTPHDVEKEGELHFETFADHARSGALVAIGETGLDYHYWKESATLQQDFLRRYLRLARECNLPVVIHCRDAFSDFFHILDEEEPVRGVLHCFTGTMEEAEEVIKRGWCLSLSGIATFKKSQRLREIASSIPIEQLLIETDAPYLAPNPHRGKRNEPAYLVELANCLAQIRGIELKEFVGQIRRNVEILFSIFLSQ